MQRNKLTGIVAAAVAAAALTGCLARSEAPVAVTYPYSEQNYVQAAEHWRVIAAETAKHLSAQLLEPHRTVSVRVGNDGPRSPFDAAFENLLKIEMVRNGRAVADGPHDGYDLRCVAQHVAHDPARTVRARQGSYAVGTVALGAGIGVAHAVAQSGAALGALAVGLAGGGIAAEGLAGHAFSTPNTEVLVTCLAYNGTLAVAGSESIFYVRPDAGAHYGVKQPGRMMGISAQ